MLTALLVGIGAGLGAVVFRLLINGVQHISYVQIGNLLSGIKPYHLLIIPALGGAIVGPLVYFYAREAKGHGVPEVMEAVALRGGRIRPRVAIVKSLASAVCIGTGGSVGREGPIVQIGSALGSAIGQWLKLSDDRIASAEVVGKTITTVQLPTDCLIVSIRRANAFRVAHGNTRLHAQDRLTVFSGHNCIAQVRETLTRPAPNEPQLEPDAGEAQT